MATSVVNIDALVEKLSSCSICMNYFDHPKSLPCLHTFCVGCVEDLCRGKPAAASIACPLCRKMFQVPHGGIDDMPDNFLIKECVDVLSQYRERDLNLEDYSRVLKQDFDQELQKAQAAHRAETIALSANHREQLDHMERDHRTVLEHERRAFEIASDQLKKKIVAVEKQWSDRLHDEKSSNSHRLRILAADHETKLHNLKDLHSNELQEMRARIERLQAECAEYRQTIDAVVDSMDVAQVQHERERSRVIGKYCKLLEQAGLEKERELDKLNEKLTELVIARDKDVDNARVRVARNSACRSAHLLGTCVQSRSVSGIAVLDDRLFVCSTDANYFEVFDAASLNLVKRRTVRQLTNGALDVSTCRTHRCLYLADRTDKAVHRVCLATSATRDDTDHLEESSDATTWSVPWSPNGLSATPAGCLLITFRDQHVLHEYSTDGNLIREISMQRHDLGVPIYAVQIADDRFGAIVRPTCDAGQLGQTTMCVVDECGQVIHSHCGYRRSWWSVRRADRYVHAVADGVMITVDADNGRVLMMDPRLSGASIELITGLKEPVRVAFDAELGKVYVAVEANRTNAAIRVYQLL